MAATEYYRVTISDKIVYTDTEKIRALRWILTRGYDIRTVPSAGEVVFIHPTTRRIAVLKKVTS